MKKKLGDPKFSFYDDESFYIDTVDRDGKYVGKVRISINVTPGDLAKANPVGNGRTEPNHSPFLPPPVGRISFSLNPFTMLVRLDIELIMFIELISWSRTKKENIFVLCYRIMRCLMHSLYSNDIQQSYVTSYNEYILKIFDD